MIAGSIPTFSNFTLCEYVNWQGSLDVRSTKHVDNGFRRLENRSHRNEEPVNSLSEGDARFGY